MLKKGTKKLFALVLAFLMAFTVIPSDVYATETNSETEDHSVTVYLSLSADDEFMVGKKTGEVMAFKEMTVPYFDLAKYGLEQYYFVSESYGDDGDGLPGSNLDQGTAEYAYGKVTLLHLYLYALEVYYCGLDESEAGNGYLYDEGLIGTDVFTISGSQGSSFMNQFWGGDCNLNYYVNMEYPLASTGWGATCDQILLRDGDLVTLGHFTDYGFYTDSASIFNYLKAGDTIGNVSVQKGSSVQLTAYRAGNGMSGDYTTAHTPLISKPDVYYVLKENLTSGDVSTWNYLGKTDENGKINVDTSKLSAGEYLICVAGQYGNEITDEIVSTPGGIILTVEQSELDKVKEDAKTAINAYDAVNYREEQQTDLSNAKEAAIAAIDAATAVEEVREALEAAKVVLDAIKTDAQLTAEEKLAKAKEDAKAEIEAYKNAEDYREAQKAELLEAKKAAFAAIDSAETEADVFTALKNGKAAMDAVKTDEELTESEYDNKIIVNVVPTTAEVTFYKGEDAEELLPVAQIKDNGVSGKYHQYILYLNDGEYSYRAVDGEINLGGMSFTAPVDEEIMSDGSTSGKGQTLTLLRTNWYTTNKAITQIGDYTLRLMPGAMSDAVNGAQYIDGSNRVVTPVMITARGNALTYQASVTINGELSESYAVTPQSNLTFSDATTSVQNKTFSVSAIVYDTITAPKGAKVQMFNQLKNFNVEEIFAKNSVENEDGTVTYTFATPGGNNLTYRVSMDGKITRAGYMGNKAANVVITFGENEDPSTTENKMENTNMQKRIESSTLLNVNAQNNLKLGVGETFRLRSYRGAWQIINSDTANIMIEPDFNYTIISGAEHIEMTPATNRCTGNAGTGTSSNWMDIKGVSAGTAIVEVTYDAIQIGGDGTTYDGLYGATNPVRKGLVVINVGETENTLKIYAGTGNDGNPGCWDAEFDTVYFTGDSGELTFDARLGEEIPEKVELSSDLGKTWTTVEGVEGNYTVKGLVGGNNLLRVTKGDVVEYQIVRAAKIEITIVNKNRDDDVIIEGDTLAITVKGLFTPLSKCSGIYNPGFARPNHNLSYTLPEGVTATATGGQYDFINNHSYALTLDTIGEVKLTNGHIYHSNMGNAPGDHRKLTDDGVGTNFNASNGNWYRSVFPDLTFNVIQMPVIPVSIVLNGLTEGVEATVAIYDETGDLVEADENGLYQLEYGTYDYSISAEGYVTERGNFTVGTKDIESKTVSFNMRKVEGDIWDGTTVTEPKKDENGVYQIGTGAELAWFAQNANGTSYNAILTDDISLGGFNWTPIAKNSAWKGTFDGNGYYVTDLYINSTANNVALFGYVSTGAVIKNLGVKGDVTTTGKTAAGIVTAKVASVKFTVENCKSEVNVSAQLNAAGIISGQSANQIVINCYNTGKIKVTRDKSSSLTAGGISCPSSNSQKVIIENSYNTGKISGVGLHGSVAYVTSANAGNVKNSYGLVGTSNTKTIAGTDVTKAELRALASTLGDAYLSNPTTYNDGCPILKWEESRVLPIAKKELVLEIQNYKNADEYRTAEKEQLATIISNSTAAVNNAETIKEIETIVKEAKAAMDLIKTDAQLTAELITAQEMARTEVSIYKNADEYREAQKTELAGIVEEAINRINAAETVDAVKTIVEEAKAAMDLLKTDALLTAEEICVLIDTIAEVDTKNYQQEIDHVLAAKDAFEAEYDKVESYFISENETEAAMFASRYEKLMSVEAFYEGLGLWNVEIPAQDYSGKAVKPEIRLFEGLTQLKEKSDYTVTLKNNTNAFDTSVENFVKSKAPTAVIKFKKNYTGTIYKYFTIDKVDLTRASVDQEYADRIGLVINDVVTTESNEVDYNYGKPSVYLGGKKVSANEYSYEYPDKAVDANAYKVVGEYGIAVKGADKNFTGEYIATQYICGAKMSKVSVKFEEANSITINSDILENGYEPKLKVTYKTGKKSVTLTEGVHYTVKYENNQSIGTAKAIISGTGEDGNSADKTFLGKTFIGEKVATFKITGEKLNSKRIVLNVASKVYTGEAITLENIVADEANGIEAKTEYVVKNAVKEVLTENVDYVVSSYKNNTKVGIATVVFTGIGNYCGTVSKTFKITKAKLTDAVLTYTDADGNITEQLTTVYEKNGAKPTSQIILSYNGKYLVNGKDFTVTWKNHTSVTSESTKKLPEFTITGKGNFTGKISKLNFTITAAKIDEQVTATAKDILYKNAKNNYKSAITLVDANGKKLKSGTDYTNVAYYMYAPQDANAVDGYVKVTGNKVAMNADGEILMKVEATGKGNYVGTISAEYRIYKYNIANAKVTNVTGYYTYNRTEQKMSYVITYGKGQNKIALTEGVDYLVINDDAFIAGTKKVTIEGIGQFGGIKKATYVIKAWDASDALKAKDRLEVTGKVLLQF